MKPSLAYPPYSMVLKWDPRDDIFVVTVPELHVCHTHGLDYEDAARQGRLAIEVSVDLGRELALPLPDPDFFDSHSSDRWWDAEATALIDVGTFRRYPPYSMVLEWDPRDDIFITTIPEFRGARTHGDSYDQAARMGREVMEMLVDLAREDEGPLPAVRTFRPRRVEAIA